MTRHALHRRRHANRWRRWSAGPHSWLDRLREAAFGGHHCYPFYVTIDKQGAPQQ